MRRLLFIARLALLGLLPMATSACGFVFTHAPPEGHEQMDYFGCTEGNVGPILDAVVAGLSVVGIVYAAAGEGDTEVSTGAAIASNVVGVGLWGSAALVGFNKTKRCKEAKRALNERLRGMGQYPLMQDPEDSTKAGWGTVGYWSNVNGTRSANPATDTTTAR